LELTKQSSFEFAQSLLENQIENIRQTRGSDQTKAYQVLVDHMGIYLKDLWNLESTNLINDALWVLNNLRATQEHEQKEVEAQIAEQARHQDDSKVNYQDLTDDLQRFEIITKNTKGVMASARATIAKTHALI